MGKPTEVDSMNALRVLAEREKRQLRGALLLLLWHHQGGSSVVGQACRRALGIGQFDHLTESQVEDAKAWDASGVTPSRPMTADEFLRDALDELPPGSAVAARIRAYLDGPTTSLCRLDPRQLARGRNSLIIGLEGPMVNGNDTCAVVSQGNAVDPVLVHDEAGQASVDVRVGSDDHGAKSTASHNALHVAGAAGVLGDPDIVGAEGRKP